MSHKNLKQEILLTVWKALQQYEAKEGVKFRTWLSVVIRHAILGYMRTSFDFSSNLPSEFWDLLDVTTMRFDDGWTSNISEKGHGAQRTFALALLRAYSEFRMRKRGTHNILIAVEEQSGL